ncbi:hypothetical protein D2Q93_08580 [Alicyclobacillaceae bacterium I2511]|nr:hypothetical protein D2Q93_08580 [Alicyclobacillaceae bacterium I2511]
MNPKSFLANKWLMVLGAIGVFLLIIGTFWRSGVKGSEHTLPPQSMAVQATQVEPSTSNASVQDPTLSLENQYNQQLQRMIGQIVGVNQASVMVTLDSTDRLEVANNVRSSSQTQGTGNQSSQSNTVSSDIFTQRTADGSSIPFVTSQQTPKVRGVLVVVNAEDFFVAKAEIINAIQHVLDVPAYKISVEPAK